MILIGITYTKHPVRAIVVTRKRCNSPKKDQAMTNRRANASNEKAVDAFMTTKLQIDAMPERLKALSDDHFNTHPDEISWGDVGTLNHYASRLR